MYSFFNGTFMRMSKNNLDRVTNNTFHAGGSSPVGDSSIAHTVEEQETNEREGGTGERSQTE